MWIVDSMLYYILCNRLIILNYYILLLCVNLSSGEVESLICRGEVLSLSPTSRDDDSTSSWRCAAANSISIFYQCSCSVLIIIT